MAKLKSVNTNKAVEFVNNDNDRVYRENEVRFRLFNAIIESGSRYKLGWYIDEAEPQCFNVMENEDIIIQIKVSMSSLNYTMPNNLNILQYLAFLKAIIPFNQDENYTVNQGDIEHVKLTYMAVTALIKERVNVNLKVMPNVLKEFSMNEIAELFVLEDIMSFVKRVIFDKGSLNNQII